MELIGASSSTHAGISVAVSSNNSFSVHYKDSSCVVEESMQQGGIAGRYVFQAGTNLVQWLKENACVLRDIEGPGSRKTLVDLKSYLMVVYGPVLWVKEDGMCGCTKIVHVIECLRGMDVVECYGAKLEMI